MDDLQNQDLVDDQMAQAISDEQSPAPVPAPEPAEESPVIPAPSADNIVVETPTEDSPVIPAPSAEPEAAEESPVIPAPTPVPAPEPAEESPVIPAPSAEPAQEETVPAVVPSVHDLGILDSDKSAEEETPAKETPVAMPSSVSLSDSAPLTGDDAVLADVKQKALQQLSPLLSKLDLAPEQKFETYMEVIRASDNKDLLQPAFEAAQDYWRRRQEGPSAPRRSERSKLPHSRPRKPAKLVQLRHRHKYIFIVKYVYSCRL